MKKIETIDILIPAYNAEKFIKRCIGSIIKQTYSAWNIIVLNDGSTDNTYKICNQLAETDHRIKVFSQENQGLVETRRRLVKMVTNSYFMHMDADDLLHPQALELLVKGIKKTDADIIMTTRIKSISHSFEIGKNSKKLKFCSENIKVLDSNDIVQGLLGHPKFLPNMYSKLYKSKLKNADLSSIPEIFLGEDVCASIKILEKAEKVAILDECIYFYRAGGGSSGYYNNLANDILKFYTWRKEYIDINRIDKKLNKNNVFHLLHFYKSLCSGHKINAQKDYEILKPMICQIDEEKWNDLYVFYQKLKTETLKIKKEKIGCKIRLKMLILKYF